MAATSSASVPGSGTGAIAKVADSAAGTAASEGSKSNVPPAPTVKFVPPGRA